MEFRHILFPVDFSQPCEQAVPWILQMKERVGARLTLFHVWESPYMWPGEIDGRLLNVPETFAHLESHRRTALDAFRRKHLPSAGAAIEITKGDPANQITEYARATDVDLIMMPTHGYGRFRAALLGSVTAKVIHDSICPLWTSAHIERLHSPPYPCRLIMCGVDDNQESIRTIRHAGLLAEDLECSLLIVHAIPPGEADDNSKTSSRLHSCEALADVSVPVCMEKGEIAFIVPETARRYGADLIVIGRGRAPDLFGSLRSHVFPIIQNAPCPVLTI